jgi:hypothetical protein
MSQQRRPRQQTERVRHARQILAGESVRPAQDPWAAAEGGIPLTPLQRNFLIVLGVLLVLGAILAITDLMLVATIPFFLLALGLIAARFVF